MNMKQYFCALNELSGIGTLRRDLEDVGLIARVEHIAWPPSLTERFGLPMIGLR